MDHCQAQNFNAKLGKWRKNNAKLPNQNFHCQKSVKNTKFDLTAFRNAS